MDEDKKPTAFSGLLGQQRAKALLSRSLGSGRIAHAYLFRGADGVGKKLYAAAMAKALNCSNRGPVASCGHCLSCKKFLSGNHPDYMVESPEKGTIKIESVRRLCKSLSYPPYESQRRVVVVEDVHTMRQEAANSLLKTLEEPPAENILILTAEASKTVLATISSRCQLVPFYPLRFEETVRLLTTVHGLDSEESHLLARLAEGSPGKALLLQENDMMTTWKKVVAVLSDLQYKDDRYCTVILQLAQQMAELKENIPSMLGLLRIWLRDRLMQASGDASESKDPGALDALFARLEAVDRAERQLGRNCNRALVCENLLFRLQ